MIPIDTATRQLSYWIGRFRALPRVLGQPGINACGRQNVRREQREAGRRILDILAGMSEDEIDALTEDRDGVPAAIRRFKRNGLPQLPPSSPGGPF